MKSGVVENAEWGKSNLEGAGWQVAGRIYPGANVLVAARYKVFLLVARESERREGESRGGEEGGRLGHSRARSRVRRRSSLARSIVIPKVVRAAAGGIDRRSTDEGGTREAERGSGARRDVRRERAQDGTFEDRGADGLQERKMRVFPIVISSSPPKIVW